MSSTNENPPTATGVVYGVADAWISQSVMTRRGEVWAADDPVVREHPAAFTSDPFAAGLVRRSAPPPAVSAVEDTSAAPGARRRVRTYAGETRPTGGDAA